MQLQKQNSGPNLSTLDVTVSSRYGPNVIRVTIDEALSGDEEQSKRFHVPDAPEKDPNTMGVDVTNWVTAAEQGQEFTLTVHAAGQPTESYFTINPQGL